MKSVRNEAVRVYTGETAMTICYMLSRSEDGNCSITVSNATTGERAMAFDITRNPLVAEELYQALIRGRVTTVTFHDVVEDFIADI